MNAWNSPAMEDVAVSQQRKKVTGVVEDEFGPIAGAAVVIKGTTTGGITDMNGQFSMDVSSGETIVISFLGYVTQEVGYAGQDHLTIKLVEDTQTLDEVVVTALGIKKDAKKLGYAVSTIAASELVKTGTPNFATSLYGKASGVRIQAAPGGGTSAVSINIRGINSISGTNQPLIVVDGIPIRNGDANNDGYWTDQRVQGNGLVDINPEDIADLSILKGASASALYGSEAANGVVLITTKSGSGKKGVTVDFSATFGFDKAAYLPEQQTIYGPGDRHEARTGDWLTGNGFITETYKGQQYIRPRYETGYLFGPKFDGRDVLYWDGNVRKYDPYQSDGKAWEKLFRTGNHGIYNVAVTAGGDKSSTRFSYTYQDEQPLQRDSKNGKHNFNISGMLQAHNRVKIEYNVSYMRRSITNRPYRFSRLTNNFTGMFSNFDDPDRLWDMTNTSLGYLNVFGSNAETPTPDESFLWTLGGARDLVNEYYWNIKKKRSEEEINRLIGNLTATVDIYEGLSLRAKLGTDLTAEKIENMNSTEKPLVLGATGSYSLENKRFESYFGEALLQYAKDFSDMWGITASVGYNLREIKNYTSMVGTRDGLAVENWFHLNASKNNRHDTKMLKENSLKQAFFGMASVGFNNYLFLEGTIRNEKSSTLLTGDNSYTYPSVNASLVISEMLGNHNPSFLDYAKIRASYGIVGNAPEIYKANFAYEQGSVNNYIWNQFPEKLPNSKLKAEEKHEMEFGLEGKFLKNRLGFEATYYSNTIKDQILESTTPWSAGAEKMWENIGEMQNHGWEFSIYGTPIRTRNLQWDLRANFGLNRNKVNKLSNGTDRIQHQSLDGAVLLVSNVGERLGDMYAYVPKEINGQPVVGTNGLYVMDESEHKKIGNITPDAVGGASTTISWKDFFIDASIDFSIGGDIVNTPYQYMMNRGYLKQSLKWRDAAHGGVSYYYTNPGDLSSKVLVTDASPAPAGAQVYDDGVILNGVNEDGSPNKYIASAGTYYANLYGWGAGSARSYKQSVFDNSYVKFRELSVGYTVPQNISGKFGCNRLMISLYGRNLFYIYKNLPAFDAEAVDGTKWDSRYQIGGSTASARSYGISLRASF
jgi:TonB-linked SusC/RagA family outer membrane protein